MGRRRGRSARAASPPGELPPFKRVRKLDEDSGSYGPSAEPSRMYSGSIEPSAEPSREATPGNADVGPNRQEIEQTNGRVKEQDRTYEQTGQKLDRQYQANAEASNVQPNGHFHSIEAGRQVYNEGHGQMYIQATYPGKFFIWHSIVQGVLHIHIAQLMMSSFIRKDKRKPAQQRSLIWELLHELRTSCKLLSVIKSQSTMVMGKRVGSSWPEDQIVQNLRWKHRLWLEMQVNMLRTSLMIEQAWTIKYQGCKYSTMETSMTLILHTIRWERLSDFNGLHVVGNW